MMKSLAERNYKISRAKEMQAVTRVNESKCQMKDARRVFYFAC